ncbi:HNH endonuclease signature motif containing protein [Nocardioides marmorisolisilvae]|uniref:HNH endonuclease n=1 Tax=Nocardioides marmorisolisilvae TaxID=1542737 RepID=A0A3N0DJM6_9ACTN|nr:HNH endonuclease signature motif containing protein [Nocardioides marmorisolisilvae]RNL75443.1 HNH endonuclease [Nocardioides marmorisolisilvae]
MDEFNTAVLNDHDLLLGGVVDLVAENQASARRWARMVELHRRHPDTDGNFSLSAASWVAADTSEAWAMGDQFARSQLNTALFLSRHLPEVWDLCLQGSLDRFRATTIADVIRKRLDDPADWMRVAAKIVPFLRKHVRRFAEFNIEVVNCTITQLRNKLNYETRVLAPADEEFVRRFADRSVAVWEDEDGTASLSISTSVDEARLAKHRLWLSAKAKRDAGDPRTVSQLMSDLALDLIIGRAEGLPVPNFARPIVNVTVSLETLAGLNDDPATLSGGTVIPADLARAIATKEGATWYRLLTDAQGEPVSLSTTSYTPTPPIWRYVVATRTTCSHEGCDRPAVECELDHDKPYPLGETSTENLNPLCRRHHRLKHARAERPDLHWEYDPVGAFLHTLRTAA